MSELLERHLNRLSLQMGGFLRGFKDPAVHLGTPEQFAREFRKVLEVPLLTNPDSGDPIPYTQAMQLVRAPAIEPEISDPVTTLARGLGGPSTSTAETRRIVTLGVLKPQLARLLRTPVLRIYISVSDRKGFSEAIESIAKADAFPLAYDPRAPIDPAVESFRPLPMAPAVLAAVSFDMLREVVALDLVESYQEEGAIGPVVAAEDPR